MKPTIFIVTAVLTIVFLVSINSSSQSARGSQDTTKVEYWKEVARHWELKAHESERRAKLNEAQAIMVMKQKLSCEKRNEELNKLLAQQKRSIDSLATKTK